MEILSSNSFEIEKTAFKNSKINKNFHFSNNLKIERSKSFSPEKSSELFEDKNTKQSISIFKHKKFISNFSNKKTKAKLFMNKKIRKDIYGNIIEKGGKYKVSFKDDKKGKYLVEMTLIDTKQSSLKGENYKLYTIERESKDKEGLTCSGLCLVF